MLDLALARLDWHRLDLGPLVVEVTADALVLDGTRPSFTPVDAQRIADHYGAALLTPKLADEVWLRADARLTPHTQPIVGAGKCPACGVHHAGPWALCTACGMVEHSRAVDDELAGLAVASKLPQDRPALLGTVGKPWALAASCFVRPGRIGAPYGWHVEHGPFASVTGCCHVLQPCSPVAPHDGSQLDYAEPWRGWRPVGRSFADVWADPNLLAAVCHDRPPSWRLPGVALISDC